MSLLFYWRMVWVDLEPVYYHVKVDSSHVFVRPSKAIVMLFEELDEYKVQLRAETCSDLDFVIWKVRMDAYIIKFIYTRLVGLQVFSCGRL